MQYVSMYVFIQLEVNGLCIHDKILCKFSVKNTYNIQKPGETTKTFHRGFFLTASAAASPRNYFCSCRRRSRRLLF